MSNERDTPPKRKLKLSPITVRVLLAPDDDACACEGVTSSGIEVPGTDTKNDCVAPLVVSVAMPERPHPHRITTITTITTVTTVTTVTVHH
jgi:hypothetical protein